MTQTHSTCPQCSTPLQQENRLLGRFLRFGKEQLSFCPSCLFPVMLLGGRFRLDLVIGRGSFGKVYKAFDLQEQSDCAIKAIRPDSFPPDVWPEIQKRFRREVQVTSELSKESPHIVRFFGGLGEIRSWGLYCAMELLEGQLLKDWMRSLQLPKDWLQIFHVFRQLCHALSVAHGQGVLHRDLKPENVFLVQRGEDPHFVKLLDFGIAKHLGPIGTTILTQGPMGSPPYMAPEQWQEDAPTDHRTDIYALGILLTKMLTGQFPFPTGHKKMTLHRWMVHHTQTPPQSLSQLKPELPHVPPLEDAILKALAKDPQERFANIEGFEAAIVPHLHTTALGSNAPVASSLPSTTTPKSPEAPEHKLSSPPPTPTINVPNRSSQRQTPPAVPLKDEEDPTYSQIVFWQRLQWLGFWALIFSIGAAVFFGLMGPHLDPKKAKRSTPLKPLNPFQNLGSKKPGQDAKGEKEVCFTFEPKKTQASSRSLRRKARNLQKCLESALKKLGGGCVAQKQGWYAHHSRGRPYVRYMSELRWTSQLWYSTPQCAQKVTQQAIHHAKRYCQGLDRIFNKGTCSSFLGMIRSKCSHKDSSCFNKLVRWPRLRKSARDLGK